MILSKIWSLEFYISRDNNRSKLIFCGADKERVNVKIIY